MKIIRALWLRNLKDFTRDKTRLIISLIIPFFFVYVFSSIFKNEAIENPTTYLMAGIIISTVFQTSLSLSTSTIDDVASGFMKEILVSPIKRIYIAIAQIISSATVSTIQGILILIASLFLGFKFTSIFTILLIILTMIFVGLCFSGFGLFLSTIAKTTQTFQVIETAIMLPFTFLSGAYLPISMLPNLLKYFSYFNPMTYSTSLFRMIVLEKYNNNIETLINEGIMFKISNFTVTPLICVIYLLIFGLFFMIMSTIYFNLLDFSKLKRSK